MVEVCCFMCTATEDLCDIIEGQDAEVGYEIAFISHGIVHGQRLIQ